MRYRQGVEAYRAGRFRESIDYFLEADGLSPNAALSFNIGRAYEKIDDTAAALRWYRDYLRRAPDASDRAPTETLIHGFETRLAQKGVQQITIQSDPSAATLVLDGRPVGVTPFTTELPPGAHGVELRLDGHQPISKTVDIPADHATDVSIALPALQLAPTVNPPSAAPVPSSGTSHPGDQGQQTKSPMRTMGLVGLGVGGAALGGALVFELLRHSAESDARAATTQIGYADRLDTMESRQTAARILAVAGAGLTIAGGVLFFVGDRKERASAPSVSAACLPTACWSTVKGQF
jgi:tetratricopeptide (TPR) repeat protein